MAASSGATKVIRCKCVHVYQDKRYGKSMRVHNRLGNRSENGYRCTVCKNTTK